MSDPSAGVRRTVHGLVTALVVAGLVAGWLVLRDPAPVYHAEFTDASGLVAKNDVRVNDVIVGAVKAVHLDGLTARVDFTIDVEVDLPAESRATIRQASLLGDKFLEIVPDGDGDLQPGDTIPADRTRHAEGLETIVDAGTELASAMAFSGSELAGRLGSSALNELIRAGEIAIVTDDGQTLAELTDDATAAARTFTDAGDDLDATIDRMHAVADAYAPRTERLAASMDGLADGLEVLAERDEALATFTTELTRFSSTMATMLTGNRDQLLVFAGQMRQVLGEVVDTLDEIDRGILALYDFNASWACIGSGNYINQSFTLMPEAATIQYGPGHCDPERGPRSRDEGGQFVVGDGAEPPVPEEWQQGWHEDERHTYEDPQPAEQEAESSRDDQDGEG